MGKRNICILSIFFVAGLLFGLHSCGLEDSYKEFVIETIEDYDIKDCLTSKELDFARINGVIIVPEIKEIDWGKYVIYISAYSETGQEKVTVQMISLKDESENIIFNQKMDENIIFQATSDGIFDGWINGAYLTENDIKFDDGKKFRLAVQIQVEDGMQKTIKEISYEVTMMQYRSFVAPT